MITTILKIDTQISSAYSGLLKTFFEANELQVTCEERTGGIRNYITLAYEEDSDTAVSLTMLSVKHMGVENMLCDFLIQCGILPYAISTASPAQPRDMKTVEKQWEEHRKKIGLG